MSNQIKSHNFETMHESATVVVATGDKHTKYKKGEGEGERVLKLASQCKHATVNDQPPCR